MSKEEIFWWLLEYNSKMLAIQLENWEADRKRERRE